MVEIVEEMKKRMRMPYGTICKTLQLSLASFKRWRYRIRGSMVLINPPGPKKVEPFDPSVLDREIQLLNHGTKRSAGTTGLYQRYCFSVSRRELGEMVDRVRHDLEADRRGRVRWIEWLTPGIVWAMDATGYDLGRVGKIHLSMETETNEKLLFENHTFLFLNSTAEEGSGKLYSASE